MIIPICHNFYENLVTANLSQSVQRPMVAITAECWRNGMNACRLSVDAKERTENVAGHGSAAAVRLLDFDHTG